MRPDDAALCRMGLRKGDWVDTPYDGRGIVVGCDSRGHRVLVSVNGEHKLWHPRRLSMVKMGAEPEETSTAAADRPAYVVTFKEPAWDGMSDVLEGMLRRHGIWAEASLSEDRRTMTVHVEDDDLLKLGRIAEWMDAAGWRSILPTRSKHG